MSVVASADTVKQLRERTGAGMMDCKAALVENGGDIEKAIDSLRKKGMAQAAKRAGREAKEGQIAARIEGKKAAVVEVNCETDFVARTEDFKQFAEMVLAETMVCGDGAVLSAAVTHRVAEMSGKIGEKIQARRSKLVSATDGNFFIYLHSNNKLGVILELACKNPQTAQNAAFAQLGKDLAMQVAASNPLCILRQEVPAEVIEREKAVYREEIKGKPENIVEKIMQGKLEKFYQGCCFPEQIYIKNDKQTVRQLIDETSKTLGDSIQIKQFVRWQLGEAIVSN